MHKDKYKRFDSFTFQIIIGKEKAVIIITIVCPTENIGHLKWHQSLFNKANRQSHSCINMMAPLHSHSVQIYEFILIFNQCIK